MDPRVSPLPTEQKHCRNDIPLEKSYCANSRDQQFACKLQKLSRKDPRVSSGCGRELIAPKNRISKTDTPEAGTPRNRSPKNPFPDSGQLHSHFIRDPDVQLDLTVDELVKHLVSRNKVNIRELTLGNVCCYPHVTDVLDSGPGVWTQSALLGEKHSRYS